LNRSLAHLPLASVFDLAIAFAPDAWTSDGWLGTAAGMLLFDRHERRGRIGEAVAAHAITNALLASGAGYRSWQVW